MVVFYFAHLSRISERVNKHWTFWRTKRNFDDFCQTKLLILVGEMFSNVPDRRKIILASVMATDYKNRVFIRFLYDKFIQSPF